MDTAPEQRARAESPSVTASNPAFSPRTIGVLIAFGVLATAVVLAHEGAAVGLLPLAVLTIYWLGVGVVLLGLFLRRVLLPFLQSLATSRTHGE